MKHQKRVLSETEKHLMRAFHIEDVRVLDRVLREPGNPSVDLTMSPPDEEFEELKREAEYEDRIRRILDECDVSKPPN